MDVASHSKRSWFMELLGSTYPEAGRATAPYLWSFLHTPTRSLAFAVGKVKTSKSQAGGLSFIATVIAQLDTVITYLLDVHQTVRNRQAVIPFRARVLRWFQAIPETSRKCRDSEHFTRNELKTTRHGWRSGNVLVRLGNNSWAVIGPYLNLRWASVWWSV